MVRRWEGGMEKGKDENMEQEREKKMQIVGKRKGRDQQKN